MHEKYTKSWRTSAFTFQNASLVSINLHFLVPYYLFRRPQFILCWFARLWLLFEFTVDSLSLSLSSRWIKFEEKVEKGGERWSKPHVATLSLHSLFELRTCIEKGTIMLDMEASTLPQVVGKSSPGHLNIRIPQISQWTIFRPLIQKPPSARLISALMYSTVCKELVCSFACSIMNRCTSRTRLWSFSFLLRAAKGQSWGPGCALYLILKLWMAQVVVKHPHKKQPNFLIWGQPSLSHSSEMIMCACFPILYQGYCLHEGAGGRVTTCGD